jgi:murein DD-endopeptidase MepM/ murein hydrolase activator NlpD
VGLTRRTAAIALAWLLVVAAPVAATASLRLAVDARAEQPGEPVLIVITSDVDLTAVEAEAFGHRTAGWRGASARDWCVLVGIDLDVTLGRHPVTVTARTASGDIRETLNLDVVAKTFRTRRLTVDDAFVNPPASAQARIEAEHAEQTRLFATVTPARLWGRGFVRPVPQPANSAFGTRSVFNGQPRNAHSGADFQSPAGTTVGAPAGGRVVLAKALYYSGQTVIIDHGLGVYSLLAHLSRIDVAVGDTIEAGATVGRVGATGRVTGPHLHWTVRIGDARVDPLALLTLVGARRTR